MHNEKTDNVIQHQHGTVIMNGGNALPGCPDSFEQFYKWIDNANEGKEDYGEPKWSPDCGYKLDYDGGIVMITSRFYPPKTHYGATWDGTVKVVIYNATVEERKFDCETFPELVKQVESYVNEIKEKCLSLWK